MARLATRHQDRPDLRLEKLAGRRIVGCKRGVGETQGKADGHEEPGSAVSTRGEIRGSHRGSSPEIAPGAVVPE